MQQLGTFESLNRLNHVITRFSNSVSVIGIVFVLWLQYIYRHHVLSACQKMRKIR